MVSVGKGLTIGVAYWDNYRKVCHQGGPSQKFPAEGDFLFEGTFVNPRDFFCYTTGAKKGGLGLLVSSG